MSERSGGCLRLSLSGDAAESSSGVSVPPEDAGHRGGEAAAGWRVDVGVGGGRDPRALVFPVRVRLRVLATAVLPDERAVLVELDVHAVAVFHQAVITLALQVGTQRALAERTLLVIVTAKQSNAQQSDQHAKLMSLLLIHSFIHSF